MPGRFSLAAAALAALSGFVPGPGPSPGQGVRPTTTDVAVITVIEGVRSEASRVMLDGFRRRLDGLGRRVELRVVGATDPVGARPDLVLALGSQAATTAARAYAGVPMIGALVARESTLPAAAPMAGVLLEFAPATEFEYMRRLLPQARRVGVVFSTDENARNINRLRDIARGYNIDLVVRRVTSAADLPNALTALAGNVDVLWGLQDEVVMTPETARSILLFSLRNRVPFIGLSTQWVRAGAVYALDRDFGDMGAQTADVAARILDGAAPRTLSPVRPRKANYALNTRSAELMRLSFPAELVRGAQEVVR
jgi:putative tryptophan/tyrosine transport system substrate-binding protein